MVSRGAGGGGAVPAVPAAPLRPGRDMAPRGRPAAAAMPKRGARKRLKFRADDVCSERGEERAAPGGGERGRAGAWSCRGRTAWAGRGRGLRGEAASPGGLKGPGLGRGEGSWGGSALPREMSRAHWGLWREGAGAGGGSWAAVGVWE